MVLMERIQKFPLDRMITVSSALLAAAFSMLRPSLESGRDAQPAGDLAWAESVTLIFL